MTSERPAVELPMAHAWRGRPAGRTFPSINVGVGQATLYRILRMSERRKGLSTTPELP
ncbi:hypothetical protein [Blastococcus capsensis]|uniref:hypothetical protein n=1 Tax=Blastococcus capsensis TaxID=1564163 RepID=UPI0025416D99|nr:hypothetical protein [Blastococcus capsensis]